jgi:hypothetical protein
MELLLNVFWLTSALFALGLWWRDSVSTQPGHIRSRLPKFLLLACVLILLFPVVSVTDDLHPLRPEMEESSPSKKIKVAADKCSSHLGFSGSLPALIGCGLRFSPPTNICGGILKEPAQIPQLPQFSKRSSRAPPTLSLG